MADGSVTAASPQDELAKLRAELEQEQQQLAQLEEGVERKSAELSYLNAEYIANLNRVRYFYEPKLRPLRAVTHAARQKQEFIEAQIKWLEKKVALQDKCATENGMFLETRDMKPTAEELMKAAKQSLFRAYKVIQSCPEDTLKMLLNYESPPDAALETMFMVLRLRGEADMNGPILPEDADDTRRKADSTPPEAASSVKGNPQGAAANTAAAPAAAGANDKSEEEEHREILYVASQSWQHANVLVSHNYFTNFFEPRSEGMLKSKEILEPELMLALEAFCENPDHTVPNLYKCSTPIGCLGQWLHAVRDIYRVRLLTAPVLLRTGENTTAEGTRKLRRVLEQITFGRDAVAEEEVSKEGKQQPPPPPPPAPAAAAPAAAAAADGDGDGDKKIAVLGEASTSEDCKKNSIIEVEADLLAKYQATKKRLSELSRPSVTEQDALYRLRHRLCQLDESCQDAREEMAKVEAELIAKLTDVRASYDDSMLPLHEEFEAQTKEFIAALIGEEMDE